MSPAAKPAGKVRRITRAGPTDARASRLEAEKLATAKAADSGLKLATLRAAGVEVLTGAETSKHWPQYAAPALRFVYHDVLGNARTDVDRIRFLTKIPGPFGTELRPPKYLQHPGTPPAAFFPHLPDIDWEYAQADAGTLLVITEGELKAIAVAESGYHCIGLGGVWSWRSKPRGWLLLPELEAFTWQGREVVIVFDSDANENRAVQAALHMLARALVSRDAVVRVGDVMTRGP